MRFAKIHFIINPAAGNDEPVLSWINDVFQKSKVEWEVSVTKKNADARKFAQKAVKDNVSCIAVYGGDGTVMEVATVLSKSDIPLAIIPGGTANVLARDLRIPLDTRYALRLLKRGNTTKKIDIGVCNGREFVIRLNAGILATMIKKTNRNLKEAIGQVAYTVTAAKELGKIKQVTYQLDIDGKKRKVKGVSLVIANSGNIGVSDISLLPSIDISDGLLDVIVFKTNRLTSIIKWIANITMQSSPTKIVRHWKGKNITLSIHPSQPLLLDDAHISSERLTLSILPNALTVVVPK